MPESLALLEGEKKKAPAGIAPSLPALVVRGAFLNPNGRRGKWLYVGECAEYFGENNSLKIIPKPLWPAPLEFLAGLELEPLIPDEVMDRCVMVLAEKDACAYFIAPNNYPSNHKE